MELGFNANAASRYAVVAASTEAARQVLKKAIEAAGLVAWLHGDGASALAAATSRRVALVVLDDALVDLDGCSVCRELRALPQYATVPILLMTEHDDPTTIGRAFEAGATDFVTRRLDVSLLSHRFAYVLRNSAATGRIERLAYSDGLTGLPNRQRCMEDAERLFREAAAAGETAAILYMDLNSFKKVNDTFGHTAGDAVLRDVATKLTRALAEFQRAKVCMTVSRFGGDEFVVLLRDVDARRMAAEVAQACCDSLRGPIAYDGLEFYSSPSIGIAVYPDDGTDVATVLRYADTAMYQAKAGGSGNVVTYTAAMSSRLRDWLDLEARLRRALHDDLLHLSFQPKFRVGDNRLVGVEALLRWCDAEYGDIPPNRFIEIAEDSGLIIELGSWVVRAACRQLRRWQDRGIAVPVAVNVSGKELLHGDPARVVEAEAAAAGVPTSMIEIEITESLLVKDSTAVRSALERLRRLGCQIALDDFGTGYSSLAYITRFPPDRIKIDKAFVHNLDRSASDAAVASAILSLGESLGVTITAEGIERPAQLEWLRRRGCHEAQGFLLSRPLSPRELELRFLDGAAEAVAIAANL